MKICFIVEDIYPTLNPNYSHLANVNGRAVHLKHLGEGLVNRGYDVSYVTMDYGQSEKEMIGRFTIFKTYKPKEGIPGLRFPLTRLPKTYRALKKADADIYVVKCPDYFAGLVSWFCKRHKKKFVYYGSHDFDFDENKSRLNIRDYYLFRYGIKNAHLLLCQNKYQQRTLERYHKRKGEVIYNLMDSAEYSYDKDGPIIWVGNYKPQKRPEMFIELSKRIKDDFVMVGGKPPRMDKEQYDSINSEATNNNIKICGSLNYEETDRLISRSKLLVSTSHSEGLANVFLQAWRRGVPVVSFVDPDDMIKENYLGRVVSNFEELVMAVEEVRKGISHSPKIKAFFDKTFAKEKIAQRFDLLVRRID